MQPESIRLSDLSKLLGDRPLDSHKGHYGHVLVVGGNSGMAGASNLAAEAAARTGAGLVSVATIPQHASSGLNFCREIMVHGVETSHHMQSLLNRASVVAIGPGLGQDAWAQTMFSLAMRFRGPVVFDADALHLLGQSAGNASNRILTPHPGEAASLLRLSTGQVQSNRVDTVRKIQNKYGGVCVLKGMGTLIAADNQLSICHRGNPGMASGGMGDTLTGIIAGLCAQSLDLYDAARMGVELHGQAADLAAKDGLRGMLASDLLLPIRKLVG